MSRLISLGESSKYPDLAEHFYPLLKQYADMQMSAVEFVDMFDSVISSYVNRLPNSREVAAALWVRVPLFVAILSDDNAFSAEVVDVLHDK